MQATQDAVVAIMVEKKEALEDLEAILSVKGIDMVQFGPSDFSMSIGHIGERGLAAVKEAEQYIIATALKKGIAPRAEINSPQQAETYLNQGVKHFCMGWDVRVWFDWCKQNGDALREIVGS